eukprot:gene3507-4400_t
MKFVSRGTVRRDRGGPAQSTGQLFGAGAPKWAGCMPLVDEGVQKSQAFGSLPLYAEK